MADISLKFGVQGDQTMKSALAAINSQIKGLDAEMKLAVSEMAGMASEEEKTARKSEVLAKQYEANAQKLEILTKQYNDSKSKLDELGRALVEAKKEFGENSDEAVKLQNEYNKQSKATQDLATQMTKVKTEMQNAKNGMEQTGEATRDAGTAMDQASKSAGSFGDMLKAKLTGEAIISGVKKLAEGLKEVAFGAATLSDDLDAQAQITGLSTDALQEYAYMAELVDTDVSTITGSLTKLARNMDKATEGSGAAYEAFETLGVAFQNQDGTLRNSQDVFNDIIDALGQIDSGTERDVTAMALFGKSAQELNPLINAGSETLAAYAQQAHDTGYVMSEDMIAKNLEASDAYQLLQNDIQTLKNNLGTKLAPVIETVSEKLSSLLQWLTDNSDFIEGTVIPVVGALTAGFVAYKVALLAMSIIDTVRKATEGMTIAQAALNAIMAANPIGLVVGAIAALIAGLVLAWNKSEAFRNAVTTAFNAVKDAIIKAVQWVKDAVQWLIDLPGKALSWGKDMIENFVAGIKAKIQKVTDAVKNVAGKVKSFLGFSEPEEGPLSNFHTYAPDMMQLFAKGINDNVNLVANASENAAAAVDLSSGFDRLANAYAAGGGNIVIKLVLDGKEIANTTTRYQNQWGQAYNR